jgi:hypothetical protein
MSIHTECTKCGSTELRFRGLQTLIQKLKRRTLSLDAAPLDVMNFIRNEIRGSQVRKMLVKLQKTNPEQYRNFIHLFNLASKETPQE